MPEPIRQAVIGGTNERKSKQEVVDEDWDLEDKDEPAESRDVILTAVLECLEMDTPWFTKFNQLPPQPLDEPDKPLLPRQPVDEAEMPALYPQGDIEPDPSTPLLVIEPDIAVPSQIVAPTEPMPAKPDKVNTQFIFIYHNLTHAVTFINKIKMLCYKVLN